jgi:uncharacterized short protein YbdD (DUF466 family)
MKTVFEDKEYDLISLDWARKEENVAVFDGVNEPTMGWPKVKSGLLILCENVPGEIAEQWVKKGARILRCNTDETAKIRKTMGMLKGKGDEGHKVDSRAIMLLWQTAPDKFREYNFDPPLMAMYEFFKFAQENRMVVANRLRYCDHPFGEELLKNFNKLESDAKKFMTEELKNYPIYTRWLSQIKGVNVSVGGGLIAIIKDIRKFNHCSSLWKYFGLDVRDGKAPRRQKGQVANWSQKGRSLVLGIIADSFIKQRTPGYRELYDAAKAKELAEEELNPGTRLDTKRFGTPEHKPLGHADKRAKRKMMKLFMSHLWSTWRLLEGLPAEDSWVNTHDENHPTVIPPFNPILEDEAA